MTNIHVFEEMGSSGRFLMKLRNLEICIALPGSSHRIKVDITQFSHHGSHSLMLRDVSVSSSLTLNELPWSGSMCYPDFIRLPPRLIFTSFPPLCLFVHSNLFSHPQLSAFRSQNKRGKFSSKKEASFLSGEVTSMSR